MQGERVNFTNIPEDTARRLTENSRQTSLSLSNLFLVDSENSGLDMGSMVVGDNKKKSDYISIMLPGITANGPWAYGDYYVNEKTGNNIGATTYGGISPLTETLSRHAGREDQNARVIQFNYPNQDKEFNIEKYIDKLEEYIEKQCGGIAGKEISLYGQSLGGKTAIYLAGRILEKGGKIKNMVLYAPALDSSLLVEKAKIVEKVPFWLSAFYHKYMTGKARTQKVLENGKKWWVKQTEYDIKELSREISGYDVLYFQIKDRLEYFASTIKNDDMFLKAVRYIGESNAHLIVLTSDIGNGTDEVFVNKEIHKAIKNLFKNNKIDFINIDGIPHINVPQTANLLKQILEKYL